MFTNGSFGGHIGDDPDVFCTLPMEHLRDIKMVMTMS